MQSKEPGCFWNTSRECSAAYLANAHWGRHPFPSSLNIGGEHGFISALPVSSFQTALVMWYFLPPLKQKAAQKSTMGPEPISIPDTADFRVHLQAVNMTIKAPAKTSCEFYNVNLESMLLKPNAPCLRL